MMKEVFVVNRLEEKMTGGHARTWNYFQCYVEEISSMDGLRRFIEVKKG
jgi:hypothetical protein